MEDKPNVTGTLNLGLLLPQDLAMLWFALGVATAVMHERNEEKLVAGMLRLYNTLNKAYGTYETGK